MVYRHPNIANLYGYKISIGSEYSFLVYEYFPKSDFLVTHLTDKEKRRKLSAEHRLGIMCQLINVLQFLHSSEKGCVFYHRDLKSPNICVTGDYKVKLFDFWSVGIVNVADKSNLALLT
jgi:serine/threonine protein kinase